MPGPECTALSRWCEEKQKHFPIQFLQLTLFKPLLSALYPMRRFMKGTMPACPCNAGKEKKMPISQQVFTECCLRQREKQKRRTRCTLCPLETDSLETRATHGKNVVWYWSGANQCPAGQRGLQSAAEIKRPVMATGDYSQGRDDGVPTLQDVATLVW